MTGQLLRFTKRRVLVRPVGRLPVAFCVLAAVAFAPLWLGTWRLSVIVRRIGPGSLARVVIHHGSMVLTLDRFAASSGSIVATYDLHAGSDWQLPSEWFAARQLLPGIRLGRTPDSPTERALVLPLWLPFLGPAAACFAALAWRRHTRRLTPRSRVVKCWAHRAPLLASAMIGLMWLHSLCFRG